MTEKDDLEKYRNLAHACIDFTLSVPLFQIKAEDFDSVEHFGSVKKEIDQLYNKGNLRRLKQICKDLIEPFKDTNDASFNNFIIEKVGIDLGIRGVDLKKSIPNEEWIDLMVNSDKISSQVEYDRVLEAVTNPYIKIAEGKSKKLESLLLQYQFYVLRDERGERFTEILRRNKSKRRRSFEHYTILFKMSPDKMNVATIDEGHQKVGKSTTSINIDRGTSGGNIFYADGINLGITMDWERSDKLNIYLPKNINITKKETKFYSRGTYIDVLYLEQ